jgi:hypothetical protein
VCPLPGGKATTGRLQALLLETLSCLLASPDIIQAVHDAHNSSPLLPSVLLYLLEEPVPEVAPAAEPAAAAGSQGLDTRPVTPTKGGSKGSGSETRPVTPTKGGSRGSGSETRPGTATKSPAKPKEEKFKGKGKGDKVRLPSLLVGLLSLSP